MIHGERFAKAKEYNVRSHFCPNCKSSDLKVTVYRKYVHFFFIPVAPDSDRRSEITCNRCHALIDEPSLAQPFEKQTKPPLYFFTGLGLVGLLTLFMLLYYLPRQNRLTKEYLNAPQVGDLYCISKGEFYNQNYYFLRLSRMLGDTICFFHNTLEYDKPVGALNSDDYFVTDEELYYLKWELVKMLEESEIHEIERDYHESFLREE